MGSDDAASRLRAFVEPLRRSARPEERRLVTLESVLLAAVFFVFGAGLVSTAAAAGDAFRFVAPIVLFLLFVGAAWLVASAARGWFKPTGDRYDAIALSLAFVAVLSSVALVHEAVQG